MREAQELSSSPSADYTATPLEDDLFEWHFTLRGPPKSSFAGGIYHGRIVLPAMYPLRPPSFRFVTPSGRFETNREICLSISGHHEESWQPAWGVRTALVALRSFMETDPKGQLGGLETSDSVRRRLAIESTGFRCNACAKTNGEIMEECEKAAQEHEAANGGNSSRAAAEVEVPSELKLAWRDELGGTAAPKENGTGAPEENGTTTAATPTPPPSTAPQIQIRQQRPESEEDSETGELAEGYVNTDPRREAYPPQNQDGSAVIRRPTTVASRESTNSAGRTAAQSRQRTAEQIDRDRRDALATALREESITRWVDRLIMIVGFLLATLIFKVMFL